MKAPDVDDEPFRLASLIRKHTTCMLIIIVG